MSDFLVYFLRSSGSNASQTTKIFMDNVLTETPFGRLHSNPMFSLVPVKSNSCLEESLSTLGPHVNHKQFIRDYEKCFSDV